jgi:hypothetical protein
VIDLVANRASAGFTSIADVARPDELEAIVKGYATLAGFSASQAPQAPQATPASPHT